MEFASGDEILTPGVCRDCFFVESGLISVQFGDRAVEVALVGRGGLLNWGALLGSNQVQHRAIAVTAGRARRVDAAELRATYDRSPTLRRQVENYLRARMSEAMGAAACHLTHPLQKRLASWIAVATELLGQPEISVTHEELARLLGVRRPTMTLELQALEGARAIWSRRRSVLVRDRAVLADLACRCLAAPRLAQFSRSTAGAAEETAWSPT